jgi:hypothetical protein
MYVLVTNIRIYNMYKACFSLSPNIACCQTPKKALPRIGLHRKQSSPIVASAIVTSMCVVKQRLRLRPQRARHNILKAATIKIAVVSDVTPCSRVERYYHVE